MAGYVPAICQPVAAVRQLAQFGVIGPGKHHVRVVTPEIELQPCLDRRVVDFRGPRWASDPLDIFDGVPRE